MSTYVPDLSGMDWDYRVTTYQRTVFRPAQKLMFDIPVHHNDRLEVVQLGTTPVPLVHDIDWTVGGDDIDHDAMSVCKSIDPEFSGVLLKSITIIRTYTTEYQVQVKFQQLFADYISYAAINRDRGIEVTPTLISNLLEQVEYLQQMVLNPSGLYSPQSSHVKILDEAPHGDSDDHLIDDEVHDVDTIHNVRYIRPIYGAFFRDNLVIKNSLSGEELVAGTDYQVRELDLAKTAVTANDSGVYRTVEILKQLVGEVLVSYRAYGGEADMASIRQLHDRLWSMEDYLSKTSHVTPATLPANPAIMAMNNKIQELEGQMRLLLQNGLPTYGDVSTGTAVMKKVTAPDAELHWWTIGTLYRVDGSSDDVLADVLKFRLKSLYTKMMFECSVNVNVSSDEVERIMVSCDNSNLPQNTLEKFTPKLRILEVKSGGIFSGVVLQLGMKLNTGLLQETFVIEDMSGRESCWKLVAFDAASTPPEDTGVLMPNGTLTWAAGTTDHLKDEATIPFKDGLNLLTMGANIPLLVDDSVFEFDQVVQEVGEIDLAQVRGLQHRITVALGDAQERQIVLSTPIIRWDAQAESWFAEVIFDLDQLKYELSVTLYHDSQYRIRYQLMKLGAGTPETFNVNATKLVF